MTRNFMAPTISHSRHPGEPRELIAALLALTFTAGLVAAAIAAVDLGLLAAVSSPRPSPEG